VSLDRRALAGHATALASGALFGFGLALAGMTRPEKVIGFLRFGLRWDPSLMFVMAGAIAVHATAWALLERRPAPLLAPRFLVPTRRDLDARLILGSAIFGVGWALGGLCPGPALASLSTAAPGALIFVAAMLAGSELGRRADPALERLLRAVRREPRGETS
jgi:hypothetical protein